MYPGEKEDRIARFLVIIRDMTKDNYQERITLEAVYDNLGKGASGAAIECLNIVSGKDFSYGLTE